MVFDYYRDEEDPVYYSGISVSPNEQKYIVTGRGYWIEKNMTSH